MKRKIVIGYSLVVFLLVVGSVQAEQIKWQQLPDPNSGHWHCNDGLHVADDWLCEGGDVTDLHWWGSYEFPGAGMWGFDLAIYADDPVGSGGSDPCNTFSQPDLTLGALWSVTAAVGSLSGEVQESDSSLVGDFGTIYYYQYDLANPFEQLLGLIYWLDISSVSVDPEDAAAWVWQQSYWPPTILDSPVQWQPGYITELDGSNMAFEITVPEPATVLLLAVGGLALKKRRR